MTDKSFEAGQLNETYSNLFDGLLLRDASQLRQVSHELKGQESWYAHNAGVDAYDLAVQLEGQPDMDFREQAPDVLGNAFRAYEYSGLKFVATSVLLLTELHGLKRRWLKNTMAPTSLVINSITEFPSYKQRRAYSKQGRYALRALGFTLRPIATPEHSHEDTV